MKKLILKITSILTICYMLAFAPVSTYININTLTLKTAEATTTELKQKAFAAILGFLATTMAILVEGANYSMECLQNCYETLEANKDEILLNFSIPQLMAIIYGTASVPVAVKNVIEDSITADEVAKAKALHQKAYADHLISTAELAELGLVDAVAQVAEIQQQKTIEDYKTKVHTANVLSLPDNKIRYSADVSLSGANSKIITTMYKDVNNNGINFVRLLSNTESINLNTYITGSKYYKYYYVNEIYNFTNIVGETCKLKLEYNFKTADEMRYVNKLDITDFTNLDYVRITYVINGLNVINLRKISGNLTWKNIFDVIYDKLINADAITADLNIPLGLGQLGEFYVPGATTLTLPTANVSSTTLDIGWNSIPASEEDYERPVLPTGTYKVKTDENGVPTEVVSADGTQTIPLNPAGTATGDDTATATNKFFEPPDSPDWPKFKNFFDIIFILIYLVMIVIKIYFKLIDVVINIASIPATTVILEDYNNIMVGFNYIKNITVPVLNISLWTLIGYMFTVFYFIYMLKIIQSLYHAFSDTGEIISRQIKIKEREEAKIVKQYGKQYEKRAFTKNDADIV